MLRPVCCTALILTLLVSTGFASELTDSLKTGRVDLQSASQLALVLKAFSSSAIHCEEPWLRSRQRILSAGPSL